MAKSENNHLWNCKYPYGGKCLTLSAFEIIYSLGIKKLKENLHKYTQNKINCKEDIA